MNLCQQLCQHPPVFALWTRFVGRCRHGTGQYSTGKKWSDWTAQWWHRDSPKGPESISWDNLTFYRQDQHAHAYSSERGFFSPIVHELMLNSCTPPNSPWLPPSPCLRVANSECGIKARCNTRESGVLLLLQFCRGLAPDKAAICLEQPIILSYNFHLIDKIKHNSPGTRKSPLTLVPCFNSAKRGWKHLK